MNEFTDNQKATIFVRDKATCCYWCKSLLVLDYGASPIWEYDCVDHVVPKSKGGKATLDNGLIACSTANFYKSNRDDWEPFLKNGKPNKIFYNYFDVIPPILKSNLKRFSQLHHTDWYLNRAFSNLLLGVLGIIKPKRQDGKYFKRDKKYFARSALKKIKIWKEKVKKEKVPSLIERGIINYNLSKDQKLMMQVIEKENEKEIVNIMEKLVPFYKENGDILEKLSEHLSDNNNSLSIANNKYTSHRINEIYKQQDEYFYILERSNGCSPINRAVKLKVRGSILWDAVMDTFYDDEEKYLGYKCQVKVNCNSIIISCEMASYENEIAGYLNYIGKKNKEGYFVVTARERDASSTLRINKDKNLLKGNFILDGEKGFWKIKLIRRTVT